MARQSGRRRRRARIALAGVLAVAGLTGAIAAPAGAMAVAVVPAAGAAAGSGPHWQVQAPRDPAGTSNAAGDSVSCVTGSACAMTGSYFDSSDTVHAMAVMWTGSHWTLSPVAGAAGAQLVSVSCTSRDSCTAAGTVSSTSTGVTLPRAEHWNGSTWKVQTTPHPAGSTDSYFTGVSCSGPSACTAVGYIISSDGPLLPMAERWNGHAWRVQSVPAPPGHHDDSLLNAVSCPAAGACRAVGSNGASPFAEAWNGSSWKVQSVSVPAGDPGSLAGISCVAARACTAVGAFNGGQHSRPLAENWNGSAWSARTPPVPGGSPSSSLASVSCVSARDCEAAGEASAGAPVALIEHWSGSAWSVQAKVAGAGDLTANAIGISCPSVSVCEAAGVHSSRPLDEKILALRYS